MNVYLTPICLQKRFTKNDIVSDYVRNINTNK